MLINKSSLKQPFATELPAKCNEIIRALLGEETGPELLCYRLELLTELCGQTGKVEFSQYYERGPDGLMAIDKLGHLDNVVIAILKFTGALFENTFFRSIYASFLEVVQLLDCLKPKIVVHTLRLLVSISKTSRFISQHVDSAEQKKLSAKLIAVHECWSRNNTPSMAEAIKSADLQPSNKITYRVDGKSETIVIPDGYDLQAAHTFLLAKLGGSIDDKNDANLAEKTYAVAQLRFNFYMTKLETRIDSAIQRLMSLSVLFYSRCLLDAWRTLSVLQQETVEDICEVIQLEPSALPAAAIPLIDNVRTEALKAMASIIFLDNPAKLQHILDTLGLNSYIGHAAQLMRNVVRTLKQNETSHESNAFITSLFSLIYHIAGLEKGLAGGPALVSISTVPTLLEVVNLRQLPDSLISFATRAVRIIDILTHIDLNEFITHDGITSLLNFLKRTVADPDNATNARRIMEVHCAVELTTMFIYQEPSQLNQLQDRGLCHAILDLLSHEYFPISREIVTSLPTTCSALCLNERGLKIFNEYKPSCGKRKNELNDAAQRIGGAFDELMRHQPTLRKDLITSMVKVISELVKDASREEIHITSRPANPSTALIPGLNADEGGGRGGQTLFAHPHAD
ncbi:HECT-type E3 ubiquitin transferase [Aphelenchoides fujianensis]|nr:HECT-type E3 ubiquitin transferase [Aphelenchoides fujianensis]